MDQNSYIRATAATPSESTVLIRGSKKITTETTVSQSTTIPFSSDWQLSTPQLPTPSIISQQPVIAYLTPTSVSRFTQMVAEIDGVHCIVAEDAEGQIVHITTFASPLTDKLREAVYAVEATIIDDFPDQVFDFHLRDAAQTDTGTPTPIPGQHFFAVWGMIDEEPGRSPQTGKEQ